MKSAKFMAARREWWGVVRPKWVALAQRESQNPGIWAAIESMVEDVDAILPDPTGGGVIPRGWMCAITELIQADFDAETAIK